MHHCSMHPLFYIHFIVTISHYVLGPQGFGSSQSCLNALWKCVIDLKKGHYKQLSTSLPLLLSQVGMLSKEVSNFLINPRLSFVFLPLWSLNPNPLGNLKTNFLSLTSRGTEGCRMYFIDYFYPDFIFSLQLYFLYLTFLKYLLYVFSFMCIFVNYQDSFVAQGVYK